MTNCKDGLNPQQQAALVAALRIAAHGEVIAEHIRRDLSNHELFDPSTVFRSLHLQLVGEGAALGAGDLYTWLREQQLGVPNLSIDDVLAAIAPFKAPGSHELPYPGFLRMILPKDDPSRSLRDSRLRAPPGEVVPEVALLFRKLVTNEIEVARRLKTHQHILSELGMTRAGLLSFLNAGDDTYTEDLISPSALRRVLVDRFRYIDRQQCEALIRRINPSNSCLAPFDDLARIIGPLDRTASVCGPGGLSSMPAGLAPTPSMVPGAHSASAPLRTGEDTATGHAALPGRSGRLAVSWSPELPRSTAGSSLVHSTRPLERDGSTSAALASAGLHAKEPGQRQSRDFGSNRGVSEPHSPVRVSQTPRARSLFHGRAWEDRSQTFSAGYCSPEPKKNLVLFSPPSGIKSCSGIPAFSPDTVASTRASTVEVASPQSALQPKRFSRDVGSTAVSPRKLTTPARSTSAPTGVRAVLGSFSPDVRVTRASSAVRSPLSEYESHASGSARSLQNISPAPALLVNVGDVHRRQRAIEVVLQVIAQQAKSDAQLERAKACLPAHTSIDAIFKLLDCFAKGYVAATDLLQFCRGFGSASTFGGFCALVREVQLRHRPTGGTHVSPSRLSLRQLGTLLLPVGTEEHDEVVRASSDAEALSVLNVLRNSEPCPGCGVRAQRDADATACPGVSCPLCGSEFHCGLAVSGRGGGFEEPRPVSAATQLHLFKLVDTAARASGEIERLRGRVASMDRGVGTALADAFALISGGSSTFGAEHLRRALRSRDLSVPEEELDLLWLRYAPAAGRGASAEATFPLFARHLQPRASPVRAV